MERLVERFGNPDHLNTRVKKEKKKKKGPDYIVFIPRIRGSEIMTAEFTKGIYAKNGIMCGAMCCQIQKWL